MVHTLGDRGLNNPATEKNTSLFTSETYLGALLLDQIKQKIIIFLLKLLLSLCLGARVSPVGTSILVSWHY